MVGAVGEPLDLAMTNLTTKKQKKIFDLKKKLRCTPPSVTTTKVTFRWGSDQTGVRTKKCSPSGGVVGQAGNFIPKYEVRLWSDWRSDKYAVQLGVGR